MHPAKVKRESIRRRYKSFFIKDGRQSKIKQERTVKNLNEEGGKLVPTSLKYQ